MSSETQISSDKIRVKGDDLKKENLYGYGVGHVLNDITAACWFNFLLYFLTDILELGKQKAGLVMLAGQIADAVATPVVGVLSDKTETRCGKRTPWYIGGTVVVIICFSLIFQDSSFIVGEGENKSEVLELIYYITLPSLFNIGWAAVQVAHMALLPSISINKKNKDSMVRLRTGFTFISQFIALIISFIIFSFDFHKITQYSVMSLLCVFVGILTTCYFLIYCREVDLSRNIDKYIDEMKTSLLRLNNNSEDSRNNKIEFKADEEAEAVTGENKDDEISWKYWMKKTDFYVYMMVYMCVRLSINVTGSMIPYYLDKTLKFSKGDEGQTPIEISIVLLVSMTGSVVNSLLLQQYLFRSKDRLRMVIFSSGFVFVGCIPILFITSEERWIIYVLAFIFGIGFSLGLSTASSLCNDVVGSKGKKGAFVYGAYSFSDKFSCGIVLYIFTTQVIDNEEMLRYTTALLPPLAMFFAFLCVLIYSKKIQEKEKERERQEETQKEGEDNMDKRLSDARSMIDDSRFTFVTLK